MEILQWTIDASNETFQSIQEGVRNGGCGLVGTAFGEHFIRTLLYSVLAMAVIVWVVVNHAFAPNV
jgi:hypothetical protein